MTWEIDFLDRSKFGADFAVRLTGLLKEYGAKEYIGSHVPWIAEALVDAELADLVAEVRCKGIYVNVRLVDHWFLAGVQSVIDLAERFGQNDTRSGREQIVDYSSPNVAKVLHAGHFRSTMISHVLGNLYEACGATVYRVNHINDFGGFGFMLEGFRRFGPLFPESLSDNDRLLEVYAIRRALERAVASGADLARTEERECEILVRYFPGASTADELRAAYEGFIAAVDERFRKLEQGDADEVALWRRMVEWSLDDFQSFYEALDITIEFVIGESFYLDAGNSVVDEAVANGAAFELTKELVCQEIAELDRAIDSGEITAQVRDKAVALLENEAYAKPSLKK